MTSTVLALGYQENWWQILTSAFMRNALIGGTLVALAAGLIGYFIIVRNTAFAAHALAAHRATRRDRCRPAQACPWCSGWACSVSAAHW